MFVVFVAELSVENRLPKRLRTRPGRCVSHLKILEFWDLCGFSSRTHLTFTCDLDQAPSSSLVKKQSERFVEVESL